MRLIGHVTYESGIGSTAGMRWTKIILLRTVEHLVI